LKVSTKSYNGHAWPQRAAAFAWYKKEVAAGRRTPPTTCDLCGKTSQEAVIQPHSEDYSSPYGDHIGQYGLCRPCHSRIHKRFAAVDSWERYVRDVIKRDGREPAMLRVLRSLPEDDQQTSANH
jgi:hypothetical protein